MPLPFHFELLVEINLDQTLEVSPVYYHQQKRSMLTQLCHIHGTLVKLPESYHQESFAVHNCNNNKCR